jgi:hypothetical protein
VKDFSEDFGKTKQDVLQELAQFIPSKQDYFKTYLSSIELKFSENTYSNIKIFKKVQE